MKKYIVPITLILLFAGVVFGSAYSKIVTYAETNNLTLQQIRDLGIVGLADEVGLSKHDLRGKGKLKTKLIAWYQAKARAEKVALFQTRVRSVPAYANADVVDVDPDNNIVMVYIDGKLQ